MSEIISIFFLPRAKVSSDLALLHFCQAPSYSILIPTYSQVLQFFWDVGKFLLQQDLYFPAQAGQSSDTGCQTKGQNGDGGLS